MRPTGTYADGRLIGSSVFGAMIGVDPKTVTRWRKSGRLAEMRIRFVRTAGGHYRFVRADVEAYIARSMVGDGG